MENLPSSAMNFISLLFPLFFKKTISGFYLYFTPTSALSDPVGKAKPLEVVRGGKPASPRSLAQRLGFPFLPCQVIEDRTKRHTPADRNQLPSGPFQRPRWESAGYTEDKGRRNVCELSRQDIGRSIYLGPKITLQEPAPK